MSPFLSVIIPSLNDARNVNARVASLSGIPQIELIVVEAGQSSYDFDGAKVLHSAPNRAKQMNVGALEASGELLAFLHADTIIDPQEFLAAARSLRHDKAVLGFFRFRLDTKGRWPWIHEHGVALRNWVFLLPYGDQCFVVKREAFEAVGGYEEEPILEDLIFLQAIKKVGRLKAFPVDAVTSARRWELHGYWWTSFRHCWITFLWFFGFSPKFLKKLRKRYRA